MISNYYVKGNGITNNVSTIVEINNHSCEIQEKTRSRRSYFPTDAPLHCPSCEQLHCFKNKRRRLNCKGGWTLGICGCCKVCAKLEGEECGGQHNYLGKCDKGLVCQPQEPKFVTFFRNGTKTVYKVEKGICKTGVVKSYVPYPRETCKPKCDPEYCIKNPRGICSASDNAETFQDCQGLCQHTSCRACRFVDPSQACKKCRKDDFKCIREFGRCIRKDACKAKEYPCGKLIFKKKVEGKFQCQVPACEFKNDVEKQK
ncbi:IGFBP N-terminal domain-containing protein [Caerostris darwini]|uniref:IGFBP N-terminal domain-containing protein n=1 Tax=Caerostris darwini TaxID=1538125 RepID=A0AAV4WP29_9ARAC|nr:IGFBP N-terminal domain-containing protein [Caerostris darwini]